MTRMDPAGPTTKTRRPLWRAALAAWALLSALSAVWALATPISASPDEPAHIVRAASVARGEFVGRPSPDGHVVVVPEYIAQTQRATCFAFHPKVTGNCPVAVPADPGALTTSTTTAGLYNPLYYMLVGWPTLLFHNDAGIYAMRIVSGILASLFAALAFGVLWQLHRRRLAVLGFAVAITPMALFLNASVNPNGVEATATLAVFVGVLAVVMDRDPSLLWRRAAIVAAAGAVAVNARGLSPVWVLVAALLPFALVNGKDLLAVLRRPAVLTAVGIILLGTVAALGWTLGSNSLLNAVDNPDQTPQHFDGVGTNPASGFFITIARTIEFSHGLIGLFGWLDTPAPPEVFFVWTAVIGVLLFAAFSLLRSRALVFAGLLLAAFLLLPPIIQGFYITGGGMIWQGRYNLPLFLCLIVGLATVVGDRVALPFASASWRRFSWIAVIALGLAQFYAFENTLRRYSVGEGGSLKDFLLGRSPWAPPGGAVLLLVVFLALCALGAWLTLRVATRRSEEPIAEPAPVTQAAAGLG